MSFGWIQQKILFVNGLKNSINKKKITLQRVMITNNVNTRIVVIYNVIFTIPFYYFAEHILPAGVQFPQLPGIIPAFIILLWIKKIIPPAYIILAIGLPVILSFFKTGRLTNTVYPLQLNNAQSSSYE